MFALAHYSIYSAARRKRLAALLTLFIAVCGSGCLMALDANDIKQLIQNHISDDVIINLVKSDGTIRITPEDADMLRASGASENLIVALWPTPGMTAPSSAPMPGSRPPTVIPPPQPAVPPAYADGNPVVPTEVAANAIHPALSSREGWLSISNHDWATYYLNINVDRKRMFLSKTPNGGAAVEPGQNVILNLRRHSYKLYGDSGRSLTVNVRECETTTLSLNPFGVFGNSGLSGVATDRNRVRSEVLFNAYMPAPAAVIVEQPPVYVVPAPPRYYHHPYYYGPHHYRGGGGFYFHYRR
ncbi:MAG: hypothetical protein FWG74_03130 [Planctomycetes bacterium]|nr:hypothetical protein [Planctomycetota bacterium]